MSKDSLTREFAGMIRGGKAMLVACLLLTVVCAVLLVVSLTVREHNWVLHALTYLFAGVSGAFNALATLERNR